MSPEPNQNQIGSAGVNGTAREGGAWHGETSNFNTLSTTVTPPAGTVYTRMVMRVQATGGENPYAFFTQPTIKRAGTPALDWSAVGNVIRIGDLAEIGYNKLTDGNTSGNDFLDFSRRASAVGWSDWSQTTEWETYWDPH